MFSLGAACPCWRLSSGGQSSVSVRSLGPVLRHSQHPQHNNRSHCACFVQGDYNHNHNLPGFVDTYYKNTWYMIWYDEVYSAWLIKSKYCQGQDWLGTRDRQSQTSFLLFHWFAYLNQIKMEFGNDFLSSNKQWGNLFDVNSIKVWKK